MESLHEKIRYLRKVKGWTQEQLARNLGLSLNTVQRWEMGKNKPSPLAKEKLLAIFKEVLDGDQLKLF
ncbi:MAG: helix-turn-helix transcriptional regulator [Deltaproteobacteria bacterium]|nr:MAG: helix-turn-helix transcriptional regulator [Deltaproteobacteria bacterium]